MPFTIPNIELVFGPLAAGAADVLEKPILQIIRGARKSVLLAAQQLNAKSVVNALIRASITGVRIRVLLERDYLVDREASPSPWTPGGWFEDNRIALAALFRAHIPVRLDRTSRLMHNNFVVSDPDIPEYAAVINTSANITEHGLNANLNHLLHLKSSEVAQAFANEFGALWEDSSDSPHDPVPVMTNIGGVRVKVVFSPEHGPEMEVMKQIVKAKRSVAFTMFSFSGSSGIDDALISVCRGGIDVRGVLDGNQSNQRWAATHDLAGAGVALRASREEIGGKLHHKLLVVDESLVIIGTFNFSKSAVRFNEEVLLVLGDLDRTPTSEETSLAAYAIAEIDRISRDLSGPV